MIKTRKILIVGSGYISEHYLKVLSNINVKCVVIGRGSNNIEKLKLSFNNIEFHSGGIEQYLKKNSIKQFTHFINLVNIEFCIKVTRLLLEFGAKNILIEKPGGLEIKQLEDLDNYAARLGANLSIAYNRRFFESINKLIQLVEDDGGIENVSFEFTEWVHTINENNYSREVMEKWIISNSSHVIDTVFYLIGLPKEIHTHTLGANQIKWHKSGSVFTGSGISIKQIPFTYNSNWNSAGRWAIEVTSKSKRFYLKPMEKLLVQNKGQINLSEINLPNDKDVKFKPGMYDLICSFLNNDSKKLLSIREQINHIKIYNKIGLYS
jgi:predicted dehydrogenase